MYDIIIIGGGPAGLTAGLYLARARLGVLLIEKQGLGGQALLTERIENYPGFPEGISGRELIERMRAQAEGVGLKMVWGEVKRLGQVTRLKAQGSKIIKTEDEEYESVAVIIATGAQPMELGLFREDVLRGRGISYCATCDGPLFRDKIVAVVGGGDTAVEEAIFLAKFAKRVFLIHRRDSLRATKILQERAFKNNAIDFIWNSVVEELIGKEKLEGLELKDVKTGKKRKLSLEGMFISVGIKPNTLFLKGLLDMDKDGYIITDENMQTSVGGIYACGDCRKRILRQVITACGEGATTAFTVEQYVNEIKQYL